MLYDPNWNYDLACYYATSQGSSCLNSVMSLIVYSWVWEYKYSIYNKTDANVSHKILAAPSMPMKKEWSA